MRQRSQFDSSAVKVTKLPPTLQEIAENLQKARYNWNVWAQKNQEGRERYEEKFKKLDNVIDPYQKKLAMEELCLNEERKIFFEGARLWSELVQWEDLSGAYDANKLIVDVPLNEESHWYKLLQGRNDPMHHEHEKVKGLTFLPKVHAKTGGESTKMNGFTVVDKRGGV